MDTVVEVQELEQLLSLSQQWIENHVLVWQMLGQIVLLAVIVVVSRLVSTWLRPHFSRLADQDGRRAAARSFMNAIAGQVFLLTVLALTWLARIVLLQITWPSNSYLLALVASLLTAWIVISISSKLIRNPTLARTIALVAWTVAALNIVGLLGPVVEAMDGAAMTVGELRVSILTVVKGLLLLIIFLWVAVAASRLLETRITKAKGLTPSHQVLLAKLLKIALISLAIVVALNSVGIDLTALAVLSGAIGLGLGFGLQKVVSNLISGLILLMDKSIKPGDVIELEETFGWITYLGARYVSVSTRDGKEYLIPNEDLITQRVVNWSHSADLVRLEVTLGVSYHSDPHEVRRLAVEAASKPERVVTDPMPVCHLQGFGDSSLDFLLRFWIQDPTAGVANVTGQVLLSVWDAFKDAGIEIPFPHREVILRTPSPIEAKPEIAA